MAQIENASRSRSAKGKRFRKQIFVDLTPMVDLAFLLITFFMLTTSMIKSHSMDLLMPIKGSITEPVPEGRTITFIAAENNQLFYYNGNDYDKLNQTDYSAGGLRAVIYENIKRVHSTYGADLLPICIIKISEDANYKNMVDLLDEMAITEIETYAIQDLTEFEITSLNQILNK